MKLFIYPLLFLTTLLVPFKSQASHWGGGELSYQCVGFGQYVLTATLYSDCVGVFPDPTIFVQYQSNTCNIVGFASLTFTGQPVEVSPVCPAALNATNCSGGSLPGVRKVTFVGMVNLPNNCTDWFFSMVSCCRNNATVNISNAFNTDLALITWLDNLSFYSNSSVTFMNPAVGYAQIGQPFVYDPRAIDPDGDRLVFNLVSALQNINMPVYYNMGLSGAQPIPTTFAFDTTTGRISFNANTMPGDYIITYKVDEYRNNVWVGATQREVRITIANFGLGANIPPTHNIANITGASSLGGDTMLVCTGQPISFNLLINDTNSIDIINIIHYDIAQNCPGATFTVTGSNPAVGTFNWTPLQSGVYRIGFIIQDPNCPVVASHQYREVTIIVQNTSPILTITDQFLCSSPNITITTGNIFSSYIWNTGETTASIVVNTAGVYNVTTTGYCGTTSSSAEIFDYPQVLINGGSYSDTIVLGDSVQLFAAFTNGTASDLYFSKDTAHVILKGNSTLVSLWTSNIFPTILDTGSVVEVCLDISQTEARDLDVYLIAPNGAMMALSTNKGGSGIYDNTCFSINATDLISNYINSTIPADSTFVPQGNWLNLLGSSATSEWQLAIRHDSVIGTNGLLNKFSIQFGGEYDYLWTPNDGSLSCNNCPNPIASPDSTTTYIVEMTNGAGCVSFDTITIVVLRPNLIDTVYIELAEDSTVLLCASFPAQMGAIASSNISTANYGTLSNTSTPNCLEYTAFSPSEVLDSITVIYCDNQGFCDTTVFIVRIVSCVWAGDTDTDQLVNNFDLLPIGLGYGQTGAVRPSADLLFDCEPNRNWNSATPITNIDYKHSDCDGNGIVNGDDTLAIVQNWGQFYIKSSSSPSTGAIPFYSEYYQTYPGATIQIPIMLGDSTNPVDSAYGIAFTMYYDETLVDTNSVSVGFYPSWFGTINNDMIAVSKNFHNQGEIQVGLTRIDQTHRNGFGQIGFIQMTIKDDIIKKSTNLHLNTHIDNVRFISEQEVEIFTTPVYTYVLILDTTTITNTNAIDISEDLKIFPNPSSHIVYIQSEHSDIQSVQVLNIAGQEVLFQATKNGEKTTTFSVAEFDAGIYVLRVQTSKGLFNKRVIVRQ